MKDEFVELEVAFCCGGISRLPIIWGSAVGGTTNDKEKFEVEVLEQEMF